LDAKSCYDRIVQPIAALSLKRQGATDNMVNVMFKSISQMERAVRTSYGDSDITYKEDKQPFHGILQGNGAGPTIWTMVSSPMINKLRDNRYGTAITLADNNTINIPAFAFVDDVDLLQELQNEDDFISPQLAVTDWQESLESNGGLLVNTKCKFAIVKHKWNKNRWECSKTIDPRYTIKIKNEQEVSCPIIQH
jgi:hypothetical protein